MCFMKALLMVVALLYMRMTALLLSFRVEVILPAAQPLLHCAISVSSLLLSFCFTFFVFLISARSHLGNSKAKVALLVQDMHIRTRSMPLSLSSDSAIASQVALCLS